MKNDYHESVMVREVVKHFDKFAKVIDATLGTAGHAKALVDKGIDVLGIEADPKMLAIAKQRVPEGRFVLGNFVDIDKIAKQNNFKPVDGVLLDLGVSNLHLKNDNRGFSFADLDQPLDMRLNTEVQGVKASDLLNALDRTQLTNLFAVVMKYPDAKKLAEAVFAKKPIETVGQLSEIVADLPMLFKHKKVDQMTLPLLALRIAVNSELENLKEVLKKAYDLLRDGGKLVILTFHSAEDYIVLNFKKDQEMILPSFEEIARNPRSRSVRMRVVTKK